MAITEGTAALIGAGISAAGSVANGVVQGKMNKRAEDQAKEQRKWNEMMMNKQNEWSVDMWNRTNEYETPAAMRQRLIDAGINPLSQDFTGQSAGDLTSASPGNYTQPSFENPMSYGIEGAVKIAQAANLNANTQKTKVDTDIAAITKQYEIDTYGTRLKAAEFELEGKHLNNEQTKAKIAETQNNIEMSKNNFALELQKFDLSKSEFDFSVAQKSIENYFESQKIDLAQKQYALAQFNASISKALADSQIEMNSVHALRINAETGKIEISNQREAAQLEADKPLMKANAYINTGLNIVDGVLGCVNISRFLKPKSKETRTTTTDRFDSDGAYQGSTITRQY